MAVTINGTTGIATPDGSAGTPPYTGASGATNGLYFPTATSAAIATNGTNAVTISSAQVVSLTNALPVTSGGTGVTTSTGSGSNVLNTSPTFTTSALFPAGTVSAPGIAASGDTNTGIYFPAADTLAFATNGTEDGRFDSVGNLLLNSATLSPTQSTGGSMAMTGTLAMGSSFKRNRIINGDMRVDQRNAGASVTPTTSQYLVDRWQYITSAASKLSFQQSSTAPSGFTTSLLITSLSSYTPVAADFLTISQSIEGYNIADFNWGAAAASAGKTALPVTLSFWVRSSVTGTFSANVRNSGNGRNYPFTYTINTTGWEQKTINIPGDTSGTWLTDNGIGLQLFLNFGIGSNYFGTNATWTSGNVIAVSGAVNFCATNGATFYITGVQLEVGSVATPYERQIYSDQLNQCMRYYENSNASGGVASSGDAYVVTTTAASSALYPAFGFRVGKRVAPTMTYVYAGGTGATYVIGFGSFYQNTNHSVPSTFGWTASAEL